jgi:hypothetical protein
MVWVKAVTEPRDTGSDFVECNTLLAPICYTLVYMIFETRSSSYAFAIQVASSSNVFPLTSRLLLMLLMWQ